MSEPVSEFPPLRERIQDAVDSWSDALGPLGVTALASRVWTLVTAGADYETERIQGTELTPAQVLAWLFDMPEDQRLRRIGELLDGHRRAGHCFMMDHEGLQTQLNEARRLAIAYRTALGELGQRALGEDVNLIIRTALAQ